MPAATPDPPLLEATSAALGRLSRCLGEAAEEVLAHYPSTGHRDSQHALDAWAEHVADRLRHLEADAADRAVELGVQARRHTRDLAPRPAPHRTSSSEVRS